MYAIQKYCFIRINLHKTITAAIYIVHFAAQLDTVHRAVKTQNSTTFRRTFKDLKCARQAMKLLASNKTLI